MSLLLVGMWIAKRHSFATIFFCWDIDLALLNKRSVDDMLWLRGLYLIGAAWAFYLNTEDINMNQIRLKRPEGLLALESIATQDDRFGESIESLVGMIVADIDEGIVKNSKGIGGSPIVQQLESRIFDRLKIKVSFITDEYLAAVLPFYSNKNHVFIHEYFRGRFDLRDQNKLLKKLEGKKGTVNLDKAVLSGIYSEYEHPFYVDFYQLRKTFGLSVPEIVGVMLHELGHAFYACYYADRTDRTNQVLASISRHVLNKEEGDIEYVYRELEKITPSGAREAADKLVNGSRVVAGMTYFKVAIGAVRSQMEDDHYSNTSFEQRADNFAARFGYGKPLVMALDKLSRMSAEKSPVVRTFVHLTTALTTVVLISALLTTLMGPSLLAFVLCSFYNLVFFSIFREDVEDYTYDKLKFRYLRIRQDMVDQLKNTKLPKAKVAELIEMVYAVDLSLKETADVKVLPKYISNFIFSGARKTAGSIDEQQVLEALASNDLFLKSAELRVA